MSAKMFPDPVSTFVVYKLDDTIRKRWIAAITAMLEKNALQHAVAARFPLDKIAEAHEAVESGKIMGHAVVDVS